MKIAVTCLVLWTAGFSRVAAREAPPLTNKPLDSDGVTILKNYDGWVNPQDLPPLPQCVAQQDDSTWLKAMTKCTDKRCTSNFVFICTHNQWLTQLSCLSTEFGPDVIQGYLPYCSRSILAKAQLYQWIRTVTGRTWLVDVGDANEIQSLSPASLSGGYASISVSGNAPECLTSSLSAPSMEPFQHTMASCSFTSITQHMGNEARPWEYSWRLRSMISLSFDTAGYNLTGRNIELGSYFDKECFCKTFRLDLEQEPCSGPEQIDMIKERLWLYAMCGPTSLPENWMDMVRIIGFRYIPVEDWHWPACVGDMPSEVTELTDQCATSACDVGPHGLCQVRRTIDRTCFCRSISYDSCGGSCHVFESRIDYVNWLHGVCGSVQDWHGLPDNWRQLASPTPNDMIPWHWTMKPIIDPNNPLQPLPVKCVSNGWKLFSLVLINAASLLAVFLGREKGSSKQTTSDPPKARIIPGITAAALHFVANCMNGFLIRQTLGYEDVPTLQLVLLWCSIPRPNWFMLLLMSSDSSDRRFPANAGAVVFAEVTLQVLSLYPMFLTVEYGFEHNFYFGGLQYAERRGWASILYAGALLWFIVVVVTLHRVKGAARRTNQPTSNTLLAGDKRKSYTTYGTLSVEASPKEVPQKESPELYTITITSMMLLWTAQWLFWVGFIGLTSEEFCPPMLGLLTVVWIAFSLASTSMRGNS
ncbi:hypothetical protein S40288_09950 [Stachybotrys chartarum IBT 40288]|nr:hypothetical protein S40288_09950 [Stachybotrys chartarum IBT 40288]